MDKTIPVFLITFTNSNSTYVILLMEHDKGSLTWSFVHGGFHNKRESGIHMTDYYELLEVTDTASVEVIRAAYKAGVKKYHPDNFTSERDKARATEQLKLLNEALEILTDENRRAQYDEELAEEKSFFGKGTGRGNTQNTKKAGWQTEAGDKRTSRHSGASGEYKKTSGAKETDSEENEGADENHDLTTHVESLIVRCKNEEEYLGLRDMILKENILETEKIQMLSILDEFTKVRLQQELNDESNLEHYRSEVKSMRWGIVFYLVIGYFLTNVWDWAFFVAIVLCIIGYYGAKDDRQNFARAERASKLIAVYRLRGFKI